MGNVPLDVLGWIVVVVVIYTRTLILKSGLKNKETKEVIGDMI